MPVASNDLLNQFVLVTGIFFTNTPYKKEPA